MISYISYWFQRIIRILIQKQITAANVNEQIKQLYQTAFPENEQIPWDDLVRLITMIEIREAAMEDVGKRHQFIFVM